MVHERQEPTQYRVDSMLAPSQWVTLLQSNAVSHWPSTNVESTLQYLCTPRPKQQSHKLLPDPYQHLPPPKKKYKKNTHIANADDDKTCSTGIVQSTFHDEC